MNFFSKHLPRTKMQDEACKALNGNPGHSIWIELLIFVAVFLVANILESIPLIIVMVVLVLSSPSLITDLTGATQSYMAGKITQEEYTEAVTTFADRVTSASMLPMLFCTVVATIAVILYCTKIEKRSLSSMGFRKSSAVPEYLVGLLIGAGMFSLAVGICAATGSISLKAVSAGSVWMIPLFFLGYLIQGHSEETLCRGYFLVSASRRSHVGWAILANSLLFSALHLGNPGIGPLPLLNLALFGIFASVYFLKRGNIWGIAAIHSMWNFMQGNFFGIRVSGTSASPSILSCETREGFVATLWNGGSFGLEGGLGVTIVLLAATIVVFFLPSKQSELLPPPPPEDPQENNTYTISPLS